MDRQDGEDQTLCKSNPRHRVRLAEAPRKRSSLKLISTTQDRLPEEQYSESLSRAFHRSRGAWIKVQPKKGGHLSLL